LERKSAVLPITLCILSFNAKTNITIANIKHNGSSFYCIIITTSSTKYFLLQQCSDIKGLVHPKMKILSVFTHPHVVKGRYLEECFNQTDLIPH